MTQLRAGAAFHTTSRRGTKLPGEDVILDVDRVGVCQDKAKRMKRDNCSLADTVEKFQLADF